MTNILDKISTDFNDRFNRLKEDLETKKDWKVLNRVLNLSPMSCYKLFYKTNNSLEDIESLYLMLVNCLLDDSCLMISSKGVGIFTRYYVTWGNDEAPIVNELHLNAMMDILEESEMFYTLHKEEINNYLDRKRLLEYYEFDTKLEALMLSVAPEKIKNSYTPKFKKP
jgi:hypothetical protein